MSWRCGENKFDTSEHKPTERLGIFDGEVETVEVKSGKAYISPSQKKSYRNILQNGYVLRFFRVDIVSFKDNEFEVRQKIIKKSADLKSFPIEKSS